MFIKQFYLQFFNFKNNLYLKFKPSFYLNTLRTKLFLGQPFDQEFYMILNVAVGGDYLDNPKPDTKWNYPAAEMWVDYVRVKPLDVRFFFYYLKKLL